MELIVNQKQFDERKKHIVSGDIMEQPSEFPCWLDWYILDWSTQHEAAYYYYASDLREKISVMEEAAKLLANNDTPVATK